MNWNAGLYSNSEETLDINDKYLEALTMLIDWQP
jgi:hypothetical protein